jgi:SAM-dependent methyltransferase
VWAQQELRIDELPKFDRKLEKRKEDLNMAQNRPLDYIRGILKRYGPSKIKRRLWDQEFSGTHWDFIDDTAGDCVYLHLEKHLKQGSILDLGCGPGNTANELGKDTYTKYVGVDISEEALAKARKRTEANERGSRNSFVCSDFLAYRPEQRFDVILFRESMYHIPLSKVKPILTHFAQYLKADGVFIVRMNITTPNGGEKARLKAAVEIMERDFEVAEKSRYGESGPTVIVFRPNPLAMQAANQ